MVGHERNGKMDRNDIEQHANTLDSIMHTDYNEVEFWYARDLM